MKESLFGTSVEEECKDYGWAVAPLFFRIAMIEWRKSQKPAIDQAP
jgi:hypothetical protein